MIEEAVQALRRGEVVAFPSESSYGLGVLALDPAAVARLFALKGRPQTNPVPVLIPDASFVDRLAVDVSDAARALASAHWPGPLTIVLRAAAIVPAAICGGTGKVGLRVPGASVGQSLVRALGLPLTATSANRSGEPPALDEAAVREAVPGVAVVLPGPAPGGPPSTVVDATEGPLVVLRQGAVRL